MTDSDLAAVILFGSTAKGHQNSETSDVDLLIVLKNEADKVLVNELKDILKGIDLPLDAIVLREKELSCFPARVEFILKPGGHVLKEKSPVKDFLKNQREASEKGIQLAGSVKEYQLPSPPRNLVLKNLSLLFPFLKTHFKNPALSLLRAACFLKEDRLLGKKEAGEWGLQSFPEAFHELIQRDLKDVSSGGSSSLNEKMLDLLEEEILPLLT